VFTGYYDFEGVTVTAGLRHRVTVCTTVYDRNTSNGNIEVLCQTD
jgi:hypothetical protein